MDEAVLDAWLKGLPALPTLDAASASAAREAVRACGASLGLPRPLVEQVVAAAGELLENQLRHTLRGRFAARAVRRGGLPGIEMVVADLGSGLADARSMLAEPAGETGLGRVRRVAHEVDIDVRLGEGTCLRARVFAEPPPRRREVGILGRALPGELVSGDHAAFVRDGDTLVVTVADGVGHGPHAHEASVRAIASFLADPHRPPAGILTACDHDLRGTRGAVMNVARLDEGSGVLAHAGVGNVTTRIERARGARLLSGSSATLGSRGLRRKPFAESLTLEPGEVLLMYTDGIRTRVDLSGDPALLRAHPIAIAERVLQGFCRTSDDALVLVVR